jgi:hypothetical protein
MEGIKQEIKHEVQEWTVMFSLSLGDVRPVRAAPVDHHGAGA